MDYHHCITNLPERKRGQHLQREERGAIQALKRQGLSNRAIARTLGCSPTTVGTELKRGTPSRKSNRGRAPGYSARYGEAVYRANRLRSRKPHKLLFCGSFVSWVAAQVREHKWSLDACTGYAKRHGLFLADEMVCTHTLYNEAWTGNLPIGIVELPQAVKRKRSQSAKPRKNNMKNYSAEYILSAADELNSRPRKKLGYATPEELFDLFLDQVYSASSKHACPPRGLAASPCLRHPRQRQPCLLYGKPSPAFIE